MSAARREHIVSLLTALQDLLERTHGGVHVRGIMEAAASTLNPQEVTHYVTQAIRIAASFHARHPDRE